ncbi:hypothetical protein [Croceicoccus naphthovorans]|uniref:hypothetical protein n=1 Tax=Croceicoccus naphthovorans TaxID=1348774 RepID=UPI000B1F3131|nr:hypothetical protein [Croceicoccus naphthovorans]MBB3992259.1 hypothetical protein [Croceicoccus naphthovorans]
MLADLADSASIIIFLVVFFVTATVLKELFESTRSGRYRPRPGRRGYSRQSPKNGAQSGGDQALASASEQLRRVMAADFRSRALLNRPETQVFKALDAAVVARNPTWQVMAQVSVSFCPRRIAAPTRPSIPSASISR